MRAHDEMPTVPTEGELPARAASVLERPTPAAQLGVLRSRTPWFWAACSGALLAAILLSSFVLVHGRGTMGGRSTPIAFQGTDLGGVPSPTFALPDQSGATIALDHYRGHPVVLTFLDSVCPHADCPLMAEYLNATAQRLGSKEASKVTWLALSLNPWHDTPTSANTFLKTHHVTMAMHYMLGTLPQLAPLWSAYHMQSILQPNGVVIHTTGVYLIDQRGRERAFHEEGFDPHALGDDIHLLLTNPAVASAPAKQGTTGKSANTFSQTQSSAAGTITLNATPSTFGTYSFEVLAWDARGIPAQGTAVIELRMTDMNMGVLRVPLVPAGDGTGGMFRAHGVLSMAGRWQADVIVSPTGKGQSFQESFLFTAKI